MPVQAHRGRASAWRVAPTPAPFSKRSLGGEVPAVADARYDAVLRGPVPIVLYTAAPLGRFPKAWISDNVARMTGFEARDFLANPVCGCRGSM
jgi:hypothetical protein